MNRNKYIILLAFLGLLIFSVIMFLSNIFKSKNNNVVASNPTVIRIDPYIKDIETYQALLQRPDLSAQSRADIEGRMSEIGMLATQRSAGLTALPYITRTISPKPKNVIASTQVSGIIEQPSWSFRQNVFSVVNEWVKTLPDRYYVIFAGYLTKDAQQGAVYVFQPDLATFNLYVTPERRGSVRVVAENGTTITLESTDGILFYFDAVTEQFVNQLGTPFPPTPTVFNQSPSTPVPYP